jgi:hypothetical protein
LVSENFREVITARAAAPAEGHGLADADAVDNAYRPARRHRLACVEGYAAFRVAPMRVIQSFRRNEGRAFDCGLLREFHHR